MTINTANAQLRRLTAIVFVAVLFALAPGPRNQSPAGALPASPGATSFPYHANAGPLACDSCLPVTPALPVSTGFQVVFIDVGQGDSELVTVAGHRMLIDGGRSGATIVQRLNALGVTNLDAIVATHPDADHVGGLAAVLEAYQVDDIYINGDRDTTETYTNFLSAAAAEPGALIHTLARGQTVSLGGLTLPVLNPETPTGDTNNDSVVLRLACGSVSVLFTGDAEQPAEQAMLIAGLSPVTVLKAGHHGSNTSSSLPFLQALRPQVAVISAGRVNPYGHPAPATLARLASVGASFEYTDTTDGDDSVAMTTNCSTYSFSPAPTRATPVAGAPVHF